MDREVALGRLEVVVDQIDNILDSFAAQSGGSFSGLAGNLHDVLYHAWVIGMKEGSEAAIELAPVGLRHRLRVGVQQMMLREFDPRVGPR